MNLRLRKKLPSPTPLSTGSTPTRGRLAQLLALGLLGLGLGACSKVPETGRLQYNLIPDKLMIGLGKTSYQQTIGEVTLAKGTEEHEVLKKVGKRISKVADKDEYDWRYSLIDDDETINAWCMPGGKIAFYTGILPVLENEAGMAFVMGHEVGHATAHHGAERLSQQLTVLGGLGALWLYLDDQTTMSTENKAILLAAMGAGAQVGIVLPFSRKHEKEADLIGMMYMAKAGYPPRQSMEVWDRMSAANDGIQIPAFISTHPSDEARKENLKDWLPRAKKRFERNKLDEDTTQALWN